MSTVSSLRVAIVCLLLSACGTSNLSRNYVSPPEATSRLIFSGTAWQASIREGPSCDNTKMVPRESWSGIRINTGKRLYIEQGINGLTQRCLLARSFEPREETTYVSEFRSNGSQCGIEIYRYDAQGRRVPDDTVRLERVGFPHPCDP